MPISSCGLRLDGEAVTVGVGLRLGLSLCTTQMSLWFFGSCADYIAYCKKALGRPDRHHTLNDLVTLAMVFAGIPVTEEPRGLSRSDGKRPNGLSLVSWEAGKPLS